MGGLGRLTMVARPYTLGLQSLLAVALTSQMTLGKFFTLTSHFFICEVAELIELRSDGRVITHGDYM